MKLLPLAILLSTTANAAINTTEMSQFLGEDKKTHILQMKLSENSLGIKNITYYCRKSSYDEFEEKYKFDSGIQIMMTDQFSYKDRTYINLSMTTKGNSYPKHARGVYYESGNFINLREKKEHKTIPLTINGDYNNPAERSEKKLKITFDGKFAVVDYSIFDQYGLYQFNTDCKKK